MKKEEILLIEYQKTQDSAEHYDDKIWLVSNLIFINVFLLFVNNTNIYEWGYYDFFIILLLVFLLIFNYLHNLRKNQKYLRCQKIEKELGEMKQHLNTKEISQIGILSGYKLLNILIIIILLFDIFIKFFKYCF